MIKLKFLLFRMGGLMVGVPHKDIKNLEGPSIISESDRIKRINDFFPYDELPRHVEDLSAITVSYCGVLLIDLPDSIYFNLKFVI